MGLWDWASSEDSSFTDLLTFAFRGPVAYDDHCPLFLDAEDPSRSLTASQFRCLVRTLIAGLQAHHVQRGDCVLLHLGNSVSSNAIPSSPLSTTITTITLHHHTDRNPPNHGSVSFFKCVICTDRLCRSYTPRCFSVLLARAACTWDLTRAASRMNWTIC